MAFCMSTFGSLDAETDPAVRPHFGLRPVPAQALRDLGVEVPPDAVDELGYTHPYCATIPMGWNAAPALAQGAHEAVLYGAQGEGSAVARSLDAVLDPAARFSSERVPALDSEHALRSHVIVIDDLLLLRMAVFTCLTSLQNLTKACRRATGRMNHVWQKQHVDTLSAVDRIVL